MSQADGNENLTTSTARLDRRNAFVKNVKRVTAAIAFAVTTLLLFGSVTLLFVQRKWDQTVELNPREAFYRGAIGTEIMPLPFFVALPTLYPEFFQPRSDAGPFAEQFGMNRQLENDDSLPTGDWQDSPSCESAKSQESGVAIASEHRCAGSCLSADAINHTFGGSIVGFFSLRLAVGSRKAWACAQTHCELACSIAVELSIVSQRISRFVGGQYPPDPRRSTEPSRGWTVRVLRQPRHSKGPSRSRRVEFAIKIGVANPRALAAEVSHVRRALELARRLQTDPRNQTRHYHPRHHLPSRS